jgi:hypothetical protein
MTDHIVSDDIKTDEWRFGTDLEVRSCDLTEMIPCPLPGGAEENHGLLSTG